MIVETLPITGETWWQFRRNTNSCIFDTERYKPSVYTTLLPLEVGAEAVEPYIFFHPCSYTDVPFGRISIDNTVRSPETLFQVSVPFYKRTPNSWHTPRFIDTGERIYVAGWQYSSVDNRKVQLLGVRNELIHETKKGRYIPKLMATVKENKKISSHSWEDFIATFPIIHSPKTIVLEDGYDDRLTIFSGQTIPIGGIKTTVEGFFVARKPYNQVLTVAAQITRQDTGTLEVLPVSEIIRCVSEYGEHNSALSRNFLD